MLKDIDIRSLANDAAYTRGCRYYDNGAVVSLVESELLPDHYTATVNGSTQYEVEVCVANDHVSDYDCSCPAALLYPGACKHVVAALKAIQHGQLLSGNGKVCLDSGLQLLRELGRKRKEPDRKAALCLQPKLCLSREYGVSTCWLELKMGTDKLYVLRNIRGFIRAFQIGYNFKYAKDLTVQPALTGFQEGISQQLWQLIYDVWRDEESSHAYSSYFHSSYSRESQIFSGKRLKLSPGRLAEFLHIMGAEEFEFVLDDAACGKVHAVQGRPEVLVLLEEREGDARIFLDDNNIAVLDSKADYVYAEGNIYKTDAAFARVYCALESAFHNNKYLDVSYTYLSEFFSTVLPEMEKAVTVRVASEFLQHFEMMPLHAEVYLDYYKDGVAARLSFGYGAASFNPVLDEQPPQETDGRLLIRDMSAEKQIQLFLTQYGFTVLKDRLVQPEESRTYDFLTEGLPQLSRLADVFYAEAFRKKPVQPMPHIAAGVSINKDNLLEISFAKQDFDFAELVDILGSYRLRKHYHRLKDGTFISLEDQQLGALADFVENSGMAQTEDNIVELPLSRAMYIEALSQENDGVRLTKSRDFKSLVRDIKNPAEVDVAVPPALKGVLRDYQVTGFAWLSTLASYGFGGILADDMGLGKTLQAIAFLLSQKKPGMPPALIVAPTSLMYNWLDEVQHFAPSLRAVAAAGTKQERLQVLDAPQEADIIVTTYNMLKKDIFHYEKMRFSYCFLDEAQHIKNPGTQNAKAVKRLQTGGYFALTGTPIENTLTELWSIFDFLMPGYLGTHKEFKRRYEVPIARASDQHALQNLKRHVAPFILRRLKKDVLRELPDKMEMKMVNEMTSRQSKVYLSYFAQAKKDLARELASNGFNASRIKILSVLTRLRQIACDPALFLENYAGGSGKLAMLEEIVPEAIASGHRLLIFSQFTTMLAIIGKLLDKLHIDYEYLDGSTEALERLRLVKGFNAGTKPVFLISLKAGGTGLNLTGADMVIHYDPWWNPAVEEQAADRAYRLGQTRDVQVLKLITKGTIEEKIYDLQEKKKALIDDVINPGDTFISRLTEDEIRGLFA